MNRRLEAMALTAVLITGVALVAPGDANAAPARAAGYRAMRAKAEAHVQRNFAGYVRRGLGGMWSRTDKVLLSSAPTEVFKATRGPGRVELMMGISHRATFPKGQLNPKRMAIYRVVVRQAAGGKLTARAQAVAGNSNTPGTFISDYDAPTLRKMYHAYKLERQGR